MEFSSRFRLLFSIILWFPWQINEPPFHLHHQICKPCYLMLYMLFRQSYFVHGIMSVKIIVLRVQLSFERGLFEKIQWGLGLEAMSFVATIRIFICMKIHLGVQVCWHICSLSGPYIDAEIVFISLLKPNHCHVSVQYNLFWNKWSWFAEEQTRIHQLCY
jgi:hypothetical protein